MAGGTPAHLYFTSANKCHRYSRGEGSYLLSRRLGAEMRSRQPCPGEAPRQRWMRAWHL